MMLQSESALISIIRAVEDCISWCTKLIKMGKLHRPAFCSRLSVLLVTVFLLAFSAVRAEISPPVEVDADFDGIVEGAPGMHHVGTLTILLFFTL
jgi:hypothetical protein